MANDSVTIRITARGWTTTVEIDGLARTEEVKRKRDDTFGGKAVLERAFSDDEELLEAIENNDFIAISNYLDLLR
jgi:hypothetical protein